MHRTTINFPEDLFQQAKQKATAEGTTVSEILRRLLTHWIGSEARGDASKDSQNTVVEKALGTYGMWRERDPDQFLKVRNGNNWPWARRQILRRVSKGKLNQIPWSLVPTPTTWSRACLRVRILDHKI
jgi:hypothetical protein